MLPSVERGRWLQELARRAGYAYTSEMARAVKTTRQTVAKWYNGGVILRMDHRALLCEVLKIPMGELMYGPWTVAVLGSTPIDAKHFYNRRGSGWSRDTLRDILDAMLPAFEYALSVKGEDEVTRMVALMLSELSPPPNVLRLVTDAIRQALYRRDREIQARKPLPTLRELQEERHGKRLDDVGPPKDWHKGWLSRRQQEWDKENKEPQSDDEGKPGPK